ncbi:MAG: TIGR03619 family F420-dependent LLM class oxidoreductase [Chloroflexi bacterium]|nr:TIGR03619 family F420-dependent LLM class oxidoreductase [Chloroflexota bacterium]
MSVKIGVAPGLWNWTDGGSSFFHFVEECERLGWDSLWLTDRLVSEHRVLEPVTAMAAIAARTQTLKFGASVLIPSLRNPAVLAKELATVDFLAGGRLLPAVGLGSEDPREYQAVGVEKRSRAARTDEAIGLLRRLWTENHVTHNGRFFTLSNVTIEPKPLFRPALPIWVGGRTEHAQRRVARLGDGWLASAVTPQEAASGVESIRRYLEEEGRHIEEDHYGVILGAYLADSRERAMDTVNAHTTRLRPDAPLDSYTLAGTSEDIHHMIQQYRTAGISKFVLRLACPEEEGLEQLTRLAEAVAVPVNTGAYG